MLATALVASLVMRYRVLISSTMAKIVATKQGLEAHFHHS